MVKGAGSLKVGKLTNVSTQKNANFNLPIESEREVEHGFQENF